MAKKSARKAKSKKVGKKGVGGAKRYKCDKCSYATDIKSHMRSHERTIHEKVPKKFKCNNCSYSSHYKSHISSHQLSVHEKVFKFKCNQCSYTTNYRSHIDHHRLTIHEKVFRFKCDICSYSTNHRYMMDSHRLRVHESASTLKCDKCTYTTKFKNHMRNHQTSVHNMVFDMSVECPICKKTFSMKSYLNHHIANVHQNIKNHRCDDCGKGFYSKHNYEIHLKVIHNKGRMEKVSCNLCDKKLVKKLLKAHQRNQHNAEPIPCPDEGCNKKYKNMNSLRDHRSRVHCPTSYRQCPYCPRKIFKGEWTRHISSHTKVSDAELKRHFLCFQCPMQFPSRHGLVVHEKRVHGKAEENFQVHCSLCGVLEKTVGRFDSAKHLLKFHGIDLYCNGVKKEGPQEVEEDNDSDVSFEIVFDSEETSLA